MEEKNTPKQEVAEKAPKKPADTGAAKKAWPTVMTVAAGVIIFVIGFFAGHIGGSYRMAAFHRAGVRFGFARNYGPGMQSGGMPAGITANTNRITGVVTAVNGQSFSLAGGGATATIQTNGSTQYSGGSSVAVNDTVVVTGTNNNGTWSATRVVINP